MRLSRVRGARRVLHGIRGSVLDLAGQPHSTRAGHCGVPVLTHNCAEVSDTYRAAKVRVETAGQPRQGSARLGVDRVDSHRRGPQEPAITARFNPMLTATLLVPCARHADMEVRYKTQGGNLVSDWQ